MLRVLIVDDSDDLRDALVTSVTALGYAADSAPDGAHALTFLEKQPTDIVLLDWTMPHMTGLDVCKVLKAERDPPYVILMSAHDTAARLVEGLRAGADDFVRKPIDFDELDVRLLAAARHVREHRRLVSTNDALRRDSERAMRIARTDPLMGIGNRLALDEELRRAAGRLARYGHRSSLVMCDVDRFKVYNDAHGHLAGDVALHRIASAMGLVLRVGDTLFRYGGEEIVALLPEQSAAEAARVAERLRASVESLAIAISPSLPGVVTISAGVAELGEDPIESLSRADAALYRAKGAGRNCVRVDGADEAVEHRVPA